MRISTTAASHVVLFAVVLTYEKATVLELVGVVVVIEVATDWNAPPAVEPASTVAPDMMRHDSAGHVDVVA